VAASFFSSNNKANKKFTSGSIRLRDKISRFCQAKDGKKKLEIDYRNLEFSDRS
jgi:hypothetical protein